MSSIVTTSAPTSLDLLKKKGATGAADKPSKTDDSGGRDPKIWEVAKKFETAFISEMLKQAKVGETSGSFSGGYGASTYQSFLVDAYAKAATDQTSFGLAETLYTQLRAKVKPNDA